MHRYPAGERLRAIREESGLTLKEVESQSRRIAAHRQNPEYVFTAGRLSQVENSNSLPSLYKLATLSEVYAVPYAELLQVYGIEVASSGGNGTGSSEPDPRVAIPVA